MNERLARLLKLHGLFCAPADDGEGAAGGGGADGEQEEPVEPGDGGDEGKDGPAGTGEDTEGDDDDSDAEGDEVSITIGDEKSEDDADDLPDDATPEQRRSLLKDLRKKLKLSSAETKQLRRELQEVKSTTTKAATVEVGEEPTLPEFADAEQIAQFKQDWSAWSARKQQADAQQRERQQAEEQAKTAWQTTLTAYQKAGTELKVRDFSEAEDAARDVLSVMQQGIILQAFDAKVSAQMVYALGKSPKRLAELAAIKDPVKFAVAITELKAEMKVTQRKAAPAPERKLSSGAVGAGGVVDNQLERLRAAAEKSGDYTQVNAYKRQQREKQRAAG
jgi:hypothetical protein